MFTRYTEYKGIIAWLASQGHPGISESNLSRWRKGGFRDWLQREQGKRLDLITMALDVLTELVIAEKKVQPADAHGAQSFEVPSRNCADGPIPHSDNGPLATDRASCVSSPTSNNPRIQSSELRKPST